MRAPLTRDDIEAPAPAERMVADQLIGNDTEETDVSFQRCRADAEFSVKRLRDATIRACDLSNTRCTDLVATRVELHDCRLVGIDVSGATLRDLRCTDCQISLARAFGTTLERCWFENCDLRECDFDEATLAGVVFRKCDLRQTRFASSKLGQTDVRGSRVEGIVVHPDLLRGAVIAPEQADVFAAAMGLRVEPMPTE
ncbi:MAG: pentapeptide repeat-containing protein [Planctomycetota bacterium]